MRWRAVAFGHNDLGEHDVMPCNSVHGREYEPAQKFFHGTSQHAHDTALTE
jgi:hypothetical protein